MELGVLEACCPLHSFCSAYSSLAWAIEFADAYPKAQVLGTDLSPIQPHNVPLNCRFMVDDATADWNFGQKFDYIHTRAITMGIGNWDRLVEQAFNAMNTGGWLELQEFHLPLGCDDGTMVEGSALWKWGQEIYRATAKVGIDSLSSLKHPERLKARGFINVNSTALKIPLGPWAKGKKEKKVGSIALKDLLDGIEGISSKLFTLIGYSPEEVTDFLDKARAELVDPDVSSTLPWYEITH